MLRVRAGAARLPGLAVSLDVALDVNVEACSLVRWCALEAVAGESSSLDVRKFVNS